MDQQEQQKFKDLLENGYKEIIDKRVRNPYSHLIYYILNQISENQRSIHPELQNFYNDYLSKELVKQTPLLRNDIQKNNIGLTNIKASRVGLGCMGFTSFYSKSSEVTEEFCIDLIGQALEQGCNFFDTAYIYGNGANEKLLAKAIKKYGREKFIVASKAPIKFQDETGNPYRWGNHKFILDSCKEQLEYMGLEYFDIYYIHRQDSQTPIEETVGALKELYYQGKIKAYGLSEVGPKTLRRAHQVHPCACVQEEYSLWSRDIEVNGVLDTCRELGISVVAYSPVGRGFLTGKLDMEKLDKDDFRHSLPRFQQEQMIKNHEKYLIIIKEIAEKKKCTVAQVALSWVLSKGEDIFIIPGTCKPQNLKDNNESISFKLTDEEVKILDNAFPTKDFEQDRYAPGFNGMCTTETI